MTQRAWIAVIAALAVVAVGVGVLLTSYRHAPLQRTAERTCIGCVTWFWNGAASVRANRLSGGYVFTADASYLVSFGAGAVAIGGEPFPPGCHEGRASEGDTLRIDDARDLRLRVPAPEDGCAAPAGGDGS